MVVRSVVAVILLSLLLPVHRLFGQGRDVKVLLQDGGFIEGELLCARDSSLLVATETESNRHEPMSPTAGVKRIPTSRIAVVTAEGHSRMLVGMGLGLVVGALAGGAIGAAQTEEPKNLVGAVTAPMEEISHTLDGATIGGLGGVLLGGIIGSAASTEDFTVTRQSPGGMASLSQFAKYPGGEPEFLKAVR